MPGSTLPNTGVIQGSIGGDSGSWGTIVNNALANYDAHDHTTGKGLRIATAAININADLTFSSVHAPTNLHRVSFASVAALAANNKSLFVSSSDNELYWRNNVGTNVKLTSGNALNVAAFVGGIGGDYTSVSAALNFDDAGNRYTLRKGGGANWARLAAGEVRLFETDTTDTVFVGHAAPAALAGSYTVTWPTALPGSTQIAQVDSAGQVSFTNTIGQLVTLSAGETLTGPQRVNSLSPAALVSGNNNNWNPTGISSAIFVRVDATGAVGPLLTGIAGGADGRVLYLHNVSAVTFGVTNEDGSSTAGNRILTSSGATVNVATNQAIGLIYDGTSSRWRMNWRSF
jgi:hypothetical protein